MRMIMKVLDKFKKNLRPDKKEIILEKSEHDGEKWDNKFQYLASLVGMSIGLGNIWNKFPAMAYRNGGGAYLIPYFTMYFLAGMPVFFMELALGQFTSRSCAHTFEMTPVLKGIGWSMVIMSGITCLYYNFIITWVLRYLIGSFRSKLIWHECTNHWNDDNCIDRTTVFGVSTNSIKNNMSIIYCNATANTIAENCTKGVFATSQYFNKYVLNISDSIENFGTPSWSLVLCLLFAWVFVCVCTMFGIKSSGKVVYVTATFPYIVLVILLIRGATLEGSLIGIKYYITPDFQKILNIKTWYQAASQVFFSLGLASGGLQLYSSFNRFNNNFYRDALFVCVLDCMTSMIGGFAIFSVLGYMSHVTKIDIDQLVEAGTGLAFVIYPEALSNMPAGPLFSVLFFLMLFTLGIDTQFALCETTFKSIQDTLKLPDSRKPFIVITSCIIFFLASICFTCPGGFYLFEVLNAFSSGHVLLLLALLEIIVIAYIYGFNNFMEDIKMMLGVRKLDYYMFFTWCLIIPLLLTGIIVLMSIYFETPVINGTPLPHWAVNLGWLVSTIIFVPVPVFVVFEIYKAVGIRHVLRRDDMPLYLSIIHYVCKPSKLWGPQERKDQIGRYEHLKQNDTIKNKDIDSFVFGLNNKAFDSHSGQYTTC